MPRHNSSLYPSDCPCFGCANLVDHVQAYMEQSIGDHIDPITDEVNTTTLAEDTARSLDLYQSNDIPEWLFDEALKVAISHYEALLEYYQQREED